VATGGPESVRALLDDLSHRAGEVERGVFRLRDDDTWPWLHELGDDASAEAIRDRFKALLKRWIADVVAEPAIGYPVRKGGPMRHFLVIYDRPAGQLLELQEYPPEERAIASAERDRRELNKEPHIEVVLLHSASLANVKRTHGAYFYTLEELATAS